MDAPVRVMSNLPGEGVDCLTVKAKDVVRAPAVSPTAQVFTPPDVASHAVSVRPVPDVSVTVNMDHGLHDAVIMIVTVCPTEREIEVRLDVTVRCYFIFCDFF